MTSRLNYDKDAAVRMLAELMQLGWDKHLDTLAVVVMVYIEKIAKGPGADRDEGRAMTSDLVDVRVSKPGGIWDVDHG